jgi:hypothetical protein
VRAAACTNENIILTLCSERERHTYADIAANHSTLVTPLCKPLFSHSNIEKKCHARDRF